MNKRYTFAFFLVCGLLFNAGCKTTTEPAGMVNWIAPNIGSQFIDHWIDSNPGNPTIDQMLNLVVTGRGSFQGKSNTIRFNNDSLAVAYEANGDVSYGKTDGSSSIVNTWERYPTGGGTIVQPLVDSTDSFGTHYISQDTRSFVGLETISVAGSAHSAIKIHDDALNIQYNPASISSDTGRNATDTWWVPDIGIFAKASSVYTGNGNIYSISTDSIVSFTLK